MAEAFLYLIFAYLALGAIFAPIFIFFGLEKMDEAAKGAGIGFKVIIFFGVAVFWVIFLWRWVFNIKKPTEHSAHRGAGK